MGKNRRGLPRLQDLPSSAFFLDDSNTSLIKYNPPFTQSQNNTCAGGTCTSLGNTTGSLEFSFSGTDVWLFGKPGGITRVFLDNQLVDVLDSSTLKNNGSALWAVTGLNQGAHTIKLGGVDGDGLNLLIDFFSVNGVVSTLSTPTSTDPNYLPPEKLTAIIIGSLVGFFALLGVIGISILLYVRRRKRRRISKSEIKLVSVDGSAGSRGRRSTSTTRLLSGLGGILPGRFSTEKRPQIDDGYGGRVSNSTDSGNPFLKSQSQYASTNSNAMTSAYSPPNSADASVPLFAQPLSQPIAGQRSFIPESTTTSSFSSIPSPPLQPPPRPPPLEQQRQQQLQQLRIMNLGVAYPPKNGPSNPQRSNDVLEEEWVSPMEPPPPSYQRPQSPVIQDSTFFHATPETIKPAGYKIINLPPRGNGDGANWNASRVPMASFSTATTSTAPNSTTLPTPQTSTRNAQVTMPDSPDSPSPPSFQTLETHAHAHAHAGPVPPLPPKMDTTLSKNPQLSSGEGLKGPRPWGGSNAQPSSSSAVTLRPEDEEPESPVDPAVNFRSHWY